MNQYLKNFSPATGTQNREKFTELVMKPLIYLILILLAFGLAGTWDYEDALRQQEKYCEMVSMGAWGDYNGNYDEVCKDEHDPQASSTKSEGEE